MKSNLLPIAKEGFSYLGYIFLSFIVFSILDLDFLQLISIVIFFFVGFIFRNPEREITRFEAGSVLSPVDGKVTAIENLDNSEYAYKVTIESNLSDVAIIRTPIDGTVNSIKKLSGTRLNSNNPLSSKLNEETIIVFENSDSNSLKVSHRLKRSCFGIKTDLRNNQNVLQSSRYGVMVNGITTIYLPQNFRLNVTISSEVHSSESLIGYFS